MVIPSMNETTSILTIPNVTSEDVSAYYCGALANRMAAFSLNAHLILGGKVHIQYTCVCFIYSIHVDPPSPPVVMTNTVVTLTISNYNLIMKCLSNMSNLNYKWIKKNDVLPSRAQGVYSSQLTIVNLKPEDSGDYQCVMSNSTGTISSNFSTVTIRGKKRKLDS